MTTPRTLILVAAVALLLGLSSCGSGGSSSTASTTAGAGPKKTAPARPGGKEGGGASSKPSPEGGKQAGQEGKEQPEEPAFEPRTHHDSGGGSKQLEAKGGDNSIQKYGSEPSRSEFAAAARALHDFLDARAVRAWGAACEYLSPVVAEEVATQFGSAAGTKQPTCAGTLGGLSAAVPDAALREAARADVVALRAEGNRGFVLFRGAHRETLFMPMAREDGQWKVAAVAPSSLNG